MKIKHLYNLGFLLLLNSYSLVAQIWRGKEVVTAEKYEYVGHFYNGLAKVKLEKKWGFIDTLGRVVVKPKYDQAENFSEGLARVRISQKGWGLVNTQGSEILKPMFDFIGEFIGEEAVVRASGQEAFIDRAGNLIKKKSKEQQ
jgi:hypothetical protein